MQLFFFPLFWKVKYQFLTSFAIVWFWKYLNKRGLGFFLDLFCYDETKVLASLTLTEFSFKACKFTKLHNISSWLNIMAGWYDWPKKLSYSSVLQHIDLIEHSLWFLLMHDILFFWELVSWPGTAFNLCSAESCKWLEYCRSIYSWCRNLILISH